MPKPKTMSWKEFSKRGGEATKAKHPDHYKKISKKGGEALKKQRGRQYYVDIRRIGIEKQRKLREEEQKEKNSIFSPITNLLKGKLPS